MIKFKNLEVAWFKGFKETIKEPLDGPILTLPNGFGKTSRLDAISYILTGKLLNGSILGVDHLDENNQLTKNKPYIKLDVIIDNDGEEKVHQLKLEKGHRSIDDVRFESTKDFNESLERLLGISLDKIHLVINPKYLLTYVQPKIARNLFLDSYPDDLIENYILQEHEFSPEFLDMIHVSNDLLILLSSIRSKKRDLTFKIESFSQKNLEFQEITQEELNSRDQIFMLKDAISTLTQSEEHLKKYLTKKCPTCNRELEVSSSSWTQEELKTQQEAIQNELTKKREELRVQETLLSQLTSKEFYNKKIQELNNVNDQEIETWRDETITLTMQENDILKYQELKIKVLKDLLAKDLPFTLKLFHKNKTSDGYVEVFTLLDNGVDYKYLNTSKQLLMGVQLCLFFQKQYNIKMPLLLDNLEALDEKNLELINVPFIGTKVGQTC